jgi:hypothetical protein
VIHRHDTNSWLTESDPNNVRVSRREAGGHGRNAVCRNLDYIKAYHVGPNSQATSNIHCPSSSSQKTHIISHHLLKTPTMAPHLEKRFTMRGYTSKDGTCDLKAMRGGPSRLIVPVTGGFIKGHGVDAEVLRGGGDWPLVRPAMTVTASISSVLTLSHHSSTHQPASHILTFGLTRAHPTATSSSSTTTE